VKEFAWTTFIFLFFLQQHVFSFLFKHTRDAICIKFFFASRVKSHLGRWVRFFCEVKSEPFFVSCFNNIIDNSAHQLDIVPLFIGSQHTQHVELHKDDLDHGRQLTRSKHEAHGGEDNHLATAMDP
jgi:hypothetical protein